MLPFDRDQFLNLFSVYNTSIHPAGIVAYALGCAAVAMIFFTGRRRSLSICLILSAMWIWTGFVYHGLFFVRINPAALLFAILFVLQGLLFIRAGVKAKDISFRPANDVLALFGAFLVLYAMLIYPVTGMLHGVRYPAAPTFGVTPCPVTLFTFGFLFMADPPFPKGLAVVPFLWTAIGGSAAILLNMPQDWLLLALLPVAVLLFLRGSGGPGFPRKRRG
ncbi:MAG: DUF6064 family protein [Parvibaculum sp.]|jgi:hypothetical protein|uniref:DUF6064 family protein n=1 Tax=Parvibaculum sp. TaxID=2024848 RepID=UPI0032ED8689